MIRNETLSGRGYPFAWRLIAASLRALSGVSLPLLFVLLLTASDPPLSPPLLLRLFAIWVVAPATAAWLIDRALRIDIRITETSIELTRRDVSITVPRESIRRIVPWRVPLPHAGFSLALASGRSFNWHVGLADPGPFIDALSRSTAGHVTTHPTFLYAQAKAPYASSLARWLAKFPAFALLPAAVLFYTHQAIAHGGLFGEYYTFGLAAYLTTFAVYWSTIAIYLVLYASIWRILIELACLAAAWIAPRVAHDVRRWSERVGAVLFYGGVPIILALRYLG